MDLSWHALNFMLQVKTLYHPEKQGFGYPWLSKKFQTHPPKPAEAEPSLRNVIQPPAKLRMLFPAHLWVREFWPQIDSLWQVLDWGLPSKHYLSGPQIRMGQGYMPKVHLSGLHGIKVILSVTISYKYLCTLRTSDFPFAAKKTTTYSLSHQCKLHNSKCSDQHLHTYWRLWGHILLFYGAQYGYFQTSDFQQALRKVIIY